MRRWDTETPYKRFCQWKNGAEGWYRRFAFGEESCVFSIFGPPIQGPLPTDDQTMIATLGGLRKELEKLNQLAWQADEDTILTSVQVEQKLSARDQVAKEAGERSGIQVMRYVRLTELIPELLDMVDEKKIAFNPAYELSFLKPDEQQMLVETMDYEQATPSLSQAQRMKKFSQEGKLSEDVMLAIMSEEKKGDLDKVTLSSDTLRKYFPKSYTPAKMQETIIKLLEQWQKKRQRDQER